MYYDRKIRYLDYFERGERIRGGGYVKLEVRDGRLRMELAVTGLHGTDSFVRDVNLCTEKQDFTVGEIEISGGRGSWRQQWNRLEDIGGKGIGYEELCGIRIALGAGREISCRWQGSKSFGKAGIKAAESKEEGRTVFGRDARGNGSKAVQGESAVSQFRRWEEDNGGGSTSEIMPVYGGRKGRSEGKRTGEEISACGGRNGRREEGRTGEEISAYAGRNERREEGRTGEEISAYGGRNERREEGRTGGEMPMYVDRNERREEGRTGEEISAYVGRNGRREEGRTGEEMPMYVDRNERREEGRREEEIPVYAGRNERREEGRAGEEMPAYGGRNERREEERTGEEISAYAGRNERREEGRTGGEMPAYGDRNERSAARELLEFRGREKRSSMERGGSVVPKVGSREEKSGVESGERGEPEIRGREEKSGVERGKRNKPVKLLDNKWSQLWAIYPHIRPFQDEREYISIGPSDFVLFPEASYKMLNNSFLLHGFYNYHHLLLARVEKKGEVMYYVGVPGNFYEKEKQVAIMFGFESFECAEEPAQAGDFGYYMMRSGL